MDFEVMYRAMDSRDRRFDGRFFVAVVSTGIYCRPICPAPTPHRRNTRFYRHAVLAELAGFRPCRRCRPEASPDTAEWDTRADLVGRGLRMIADGVADGAGVAGMARRLGVSERHLQRVFKAEIGATPGAIARSRRARLARQLLAETAMPITAVAFTAGFRSVRAFNESIQQIYRVTPTELRRGLVRAADGSMGLSISYRPPLAATLLLDFLRARAIPGVEEVTHDCYRRSIRFGSGDAMVGLRPERGSVTLSIDADGVAPLAPVVQRARQLFDLDADPEVIHDHLEQSSLLRPLLRAAPGLRLIGSFDPFETCVLTILEQRSSPATAAACAGRIARRCGTALSRPRGTIGRLFPTPEQVAGADLEAAGLDRRHRVAIVELARATDAGSIVLDGSADPEATVQRLRAIPAVGPRTAAVIAMRVLRDPDAFPATDRALCQAITSLAGAPRSSLVPVTSQWRPWRGYAAMHLWATAAT